MSPATIDRYPAARDDGVDKVAIAGAQFRTQWSGFMSLRKWKRQRRARARASGVGGTTCVVLAAHRKQISSPVRSHAHAKTDFRARQSFTLPALLTVRWWNVMDTRRPQIVTYAWSRK